MTDTYIFFTKGRPPKRIKATNHIEACEKFYEQNPDFHLSELKHIEVKPDMKGKRKEWLTHLKEHKRTEEPLGQTKY